jgi:hypothetical protein
MKLLFQIAMRVLGRMIYFAFAGAIAIPLICMGIGVAAAVVCCVLLAIYWTIRQIPYDGAVMLGICTIGALLPVIVASPVSFMAFGVAGVITSQNPLADLALSDITSEAIHGALWGVVLGTLTGPLSYALFVLTIDSFRDVPSYFDWTNAFLASICVGLAVGIFFGAIFGALGKTLPTHQILPSLRRWLKLSTHEK